MSRLLYQLSYAAIRGQLYPKNAPGAIENAPLSPAESVKSVRLITLSLKQKMQLQKQKYHKIPY
jgi:hypothetical protein